uniref:DNA-directed RNA polymerase subunit n=1 Tax=Lambia antarctica TaxID=101717 RepID=A0A1L2EDV4_9CHLO|nr:DNA-directed RNA polymerase [Lambia antarctica]ANN39049.1 DNA-directed RNA polymerase [Lambia antarctica]
MVDYECSCGKKSQQRKKFCLDCEVEYTTSKKRRYRLGYIQLISPIAHIWYLKGRPSYLSILLNFSRKKTESLVYCTEVFSIIFQTQNFENFWKDQYMGFPIFFDKTSYRHKFFKKLNKINLTNNTKQQINFLTTQKFLVKQLKKNTCLTSKTLFSKNKFLFQFYGDLLLLFRKITLKNLFFSIKQPNYCLYNGRFLKQQSLPFFNNHKKELFKKDSKKKVIITKKFYRKLNFHYYSLEKQFCFLNNHQCFYFSLYIRNFLFKQDLYNPIYNLKYCKNLHSSKFLKITGSYPILSLLRTLSEKLENTDYFSILLLERQIRILLIDFHKNFFEYNFLEKIRLLQRLKIIRAFRQTKNQPSWMILSVLPVLPPDLRPIIQLSNSQIAISDLNKLYQKVLFRNRRLQRLLNDLYIQNMDEMQYAQRLLQESVDALIENGKGGNPPVQTSSNRPLKSLSDMLKGKKGRFRQNLLGKRVDYSGRSVIVVGSHLQLYECGLPKEMAVELFQPFLLRRLIIRKKAKTILGAKKLIKQLDPIIWDILKEVLQNHPILLNRAPTLHRLSIQAFQPRLVNGRALLLHPLVCSAFNADFDGDQMAVHIPLSFESRAEAWKLLWSINNFISPSTGQPILLPSQDMVLGCTFLTLSNSKLFHEKFSDFHNSQLVKESYSRIKQKFFYQPSVISQKIETNNLNQIHKSIWIVWNKKFESDRRHQKLLEIKIYKLGNFQKIYPNLQKSFSSKNCQQNQKIFTTIGRILFFNYLQNLQQ